MSERALRSQEIVKRVGEWSVKNFGWDQQSKADPYLKLKAVAPLVGIVEECCEFVVAMTALVRTGNSEIWKDVQDAVGDIGIYLCDAIYRLFHGRDERIYGIVFDREINKEVIDRVSEAERFDVIVNESMDVIDKMLPVFEYGILLADNDSRIAVVGESASNREMLETRFLGVASLFTDSLSVLSYLAWGKDLLETVEGVFNAVVSKRNWATQRAKS